MNERGGCYCEGAWKDPRRMKRRGIPPGYCGICEVCGQPGHARHIPIPAPYTGAWCDDCYDSLANDYDAWRAQNPEGYRRTSQTGGGWNRSESGSRTRRAGC